jgi:hypothetical protein
LRWAAVGEVRLRLLAGGRERVVELVLELDAPQLDVAGALVDAALVVDVHELVDRLGHEAVGGPGHVGAHAEDLEVVAAAEHAALLVELELLAPGALHEAVVHAAALGGLGEALQPLGDVHDRGVDRLQREGALVGSAIRGHRLHAELVVVDGFRHTRHPRRARDRGAEEERARASRAGHPAHLRAREAQSLPGGRLMEVTFSS